MLQASERALNLGDLVVVDQQGLQFAVVSEEGIWKLNELVLRCGQVLQGFQVTEREWQSGQVVVIDFQCC